MSVRGNASDRDRYGDVMPLEMTQAYGRQDKRERRPAEVGRPAAAPEPLWGTALRPAKPLPAE